MGIDKELLFKHIEVHETFTFLCMVYIKISKTKAAEVGRHRIRTFSKSAVVSKLKSIKWSSFEGARADIKYCPKHFKAYQKKRIEECGAKL